MKLPKYRALALLGLLTLAGLMTPREGAATRVLGGWGEDRPPVNVAGDPDGPGNGKAAVNQFVFSGVSSIGGRLELSLRIARQLKLGSLSQKPTSSSRSTKRTR